MQRSVRRRSACSAAVQDVCLYGALNLEHVVDEAARQCLGCATEAIVPCRRALMRSAAALPREGSSATAATCRRRRCSSSSSRALHEISLSSREPHQGSILTSYHHHPHPHPTPPPPPTSTSPSHTTHTRQRTLHTPGLIACRRHFHFAHVVGPGPDQVARVLHHPRSPLR